jgi:hypothetical protein
MNFDNIEKMMAQNKYTQTISQIESLDAPFFYDDQSDEEVELTDETDDGSNEVESVLDIPLSKRVQQLLTKEIYGPSIKLVNNIWVRQRYINYMYGTDIFTFFPVLRYVKAIETFKRNRKIKPLQHGILLMKVALRSEDIVEHFKNARKLLQLDDIDGNNYDFWLKQHVREEAIELLTKEVLRRNPNGDFERAAYHMAFDNVPTITDKEKHIILNKLEFADQEIRQSFEKLKLNSL